MVRLLHTADWQLGCRAPGLRPPERARSTALRFDAVGRLAALAHHHAVDAVLVAGDLFVDNNVADDVLVRATDALRAFAPIPVLIVPGHRDAAEPAGALRRWRPPEGVIVALTADPVELPGVTLLPCPLFRRLERGDPAAGVDRGDGLRVVVTHGTVRDGPGQGLVPNRIDVAALLRKGVAYVALGGWPEPVVLGPRAAYAGPPGGDLPGGSALLVELDDGPPTITTLDTGVVRRVEHAVTVQSYRDVDALGRWLAALEAPARTSVRLQVSGSLKPAERARLDALLAQDAGLLRLEAEVDVALDLDDLAARVDAPGFLGVALRELMAAPEPRDAAALLLSWLAGTGGAR